MAASEWSFGLTRRELLAATALGMVAGAPAVARAAAPQGQLAWGVHTTDDIVTVRVGPHRILFAEAEDFAAMYPEIDLDERATPPFIAVLTLRTIDPEATIDYFTRWQIPYEALPDRRVLVPAEEANGAAMEFMAAPPPSVR